MKEVLIINGHPDKDSFNYALSEAYLQGASKTNATIKQINIADLSFDPNLAYGYRQRIALEPDLSQAINQIKQADHIIWTFPVWWYGYPSIMKGFVERTFLPGITFQPISGKSIPQKLLKGKSARLIITADTPKWYDYLVMKRPAVNQFKRGTLEFCGVGPVTVSYFAPVKDSKASTRQKWLDKVEALGEKLK